ncbi:adhesion G-protein coupled receptor G4 [Trichonephila clavipes]|nr:adhesion G-protein coupled receptor G4 [Trichonephila clavipes]
MEYIYIDDENTFLLDDELHSDTDTDISSNYLDYSSDDSYSELSSDEDMSYARIFTEVDVKNPLVPCPRFKFSVSVRVVASIGSDNFGCCVKITNLVDRFATEVKLARGESITLKTENLVVKAISWDPETNDLEDDDLTFSVHYQQRQRREYSGKGRYRPLPPSQTFWPDEGDPMRDEGTTSFYNDRARAGRPCLKKHVHPALLSKWKRRRKPVQAARRFYHHLSQYSSSNPPAVPIIVVP